MSGARGKCLEEGRVVAHDVFQGDYRLLTCTAPRMTPAVRPGQFVQVQVPGRPDLVLRRPFSIFNVDEDQLSILYKPVGSGTRSLATLAPGAALSLLGPLGNGFPAPDATRQPVLVAGGYGMAALYLLAARATRAGRAFFGGRSATDILCVSEFTDLGWQVTVATEDGSLGQTGRVTEALEAWWQKEPAPPPLELFVCGPNGLLRAVAEMGAARDWTVWVSLDRHMGCGVGACLTCVQRVRDADGAWRWARVCHEGPVFNARDIDWQAVEAS